MLNFHVQKGSLKVDDKAIHFDMARPRMTKKELERLIVENIDDNFEAIKIVNKLHKRKK